MVERDARMVDDGSEQVFTVAHLSRFLQKQWGDRGYQLADGDRVGVKVSELVQHSFERNEALDLPFVDLWVAILDECISWLISLNSILFSSLNRKETIGAFQKSVIFLLGKIIADSTALRHLVLCGLDTSAKTILRSVSEYMEVLVAILHEPEFAEAFVKSDTPENAKVFWEQELRGGKIRRRMTAAWQAFFEDRSRNQEAAEWFANWGRSSNSMLSGLAHPSFGGALFAAIPLKSRYTEENWLGFWGDRCEASVDTIYIYLHFMFPVLLLSHEFPFGDFEASHFSCHAYDEDNELHRHVQVGRAVLASLILSLGREGNESFVFPEIDMSIWPADAPHGHKNP